MHNCDSLSLCVFQKEREIHHASGPSTTQVLPTHGVVKKGGGRKAPTEKNDRVELKSNMLKQLILFGPFGTEFDGPRALSATLSQPTPKQNQPPQQNGAKNKGAKSITIIFNYGPIK